MGVSNGATGGSPHFHACAPPAALGAPSFLTQMLEGLHGFTEETAYLSPAPLYHAAPAGWTAGTQRLGGAAVVMERFDARELLAAVERHAPPTRSWCPPT